MPSNTSITAQLIVAGEVPPDQNCLVDVNTLLPVVAAYMGVQTTDPDNPQSQTDSTAELALNTANTALAQVAALQATIPARRTSGANLIPLVPGDNNILTVTWTPDMPNVNFDINFTFHGPLSVAGTATGPLPVVIDGSRTLSSFQAKILNVPPGAWYFSWSVTQL